MPFCPKCHAEYRPGFAVCPPCGDVELVDSLPEVDEIAEDELASTVPVGLAGLAHVVEVGPRKIDLGRVFQIEQATALRDALAADDVASAVVPVEELQFPDRRARFEVRVRPGDVERAELALKRLWQEGVEAEGVEAEGVEHLESAPNVEVCPACGAHVPLDVEECPDCGLVIGPSDVESAT